MRRHVYFVGSEAEVSHHAEPLKSEDSFSTFVIDANDVVDTAEAGDVAIFFSEHFDRFRQAVVELKAKRVATIYLIDGILEWRNAWENSQDEPACPFTMRPVLSDKVAVIGESQARVLSSWGNAGKIEIVGIPRLDEWTEHWRGNQGNSKRQSTAAFKVLVATAKTPGFTREQVETTARSLSDLKTWFDSTNSIAGRPFDVTWRLTSGLDQRIGVENTLSELSGSELHRAISENDAFITTPSTAMLEAMLQNKPTALLNYHQCPVYVPAAWNISSRDCIGTVLEQLALPPEAHCHFQKTVTADALQVVEPATNRLVQLIHSMFASSERQIDTQNPLKFATNLLPKPVLDSELHIEVCLNHSCVFEDHHEFTSNSDSTQLRAQLAHARREIDHLHRVQDGLRAELAEAHSIFEQIHQHPIAGPIVRIRERFIQFMKRNKKDLSQEC